MVFWCMMLLFTLMIPAVMIGFGRSFFKKPPRDINATFGYRTTMSMKNQETWQLAHRVCGRYWFICGLILLPLSVLPMLFVINRGTETIGMTGVIITHNSALTAMADRVIRVRSGQITDVRRNEAPVPVESIEW